MHNPELTPEKLAGEDSPEHQIIGKKTRYFLSNPPRSRDYLRNASLVISTLLISVAEVPLTAIQPSLHKIVSGGGVC